VVERRQYDFQAGVGRPRGLVQAMLDPLGSVVAALSTGERMSRVQYDAYALLPVQTTDALGHQTTAQYDYRLLQAHLVTDPNLNRTAYGFSPLGLLYETALLGKEDQNEGDIIREAAPAQNGQPTQALSYEASTTLAYNFFAFATLGQPCWVRTTQREQHYTVSPISEMLVKTEYSDGFGRLLQTRAQAEEVLFGDATFGGSGLPADPNDANKPAVSMRNLAPVEVNVVVSGWQVYDNKGRVVEKYEPFFSKGFDFVLDDAAAKGQCDKMIYDPRGQVIRTINPDGSEQRVIYGKPGPNGLTKLGEFVPTPWEMYSYDANDLASLTHPGQGRADVAHAFTPQSSEIDALGRVVRISDRLGSTAPAGTAQEVVMQYAYDIRGNRVRVTDAIGRESFLHIYDLKPGGKDSAANMLFTNHLDGGKHAVSFDGAGQPLRGTDAKGALTLHVYDQLGRPTQAWARDQDGEGVTRRQYLVYGTDASQNTNGQLVEHYDEAGRLRLTAFDFKGNVLEKNWQVVADEVFTSQWNIAASQNWAGLPSSFNQHWDDLGSAATRLAPRQYITSTGYDCLNRATQLTLPAEPGNAERRPVLLPTYNRAGALAQVSLDGEVLIHQLAYNARGQRLLLARGNGLLTRYAYDPVMFRLQRLRTERYQATDLMLTPQSGTTRQDTLYTYDLVGNITATRERAPQSGVGGTDELLRGFSYDALYRLLAATGRENQPTAARPWQESTRSDGVASTTAYTQHYEYDGLGNIQQLRHVASNSANYFTRRFNYGSDATNYLQAVQLGTDTVAYQYDAAGNVTQENGSRHYQWDAADQLRQFATWTGTNSAPTLLTYYLYSGGQRVKKLTQTSADTWQVTVYAEDGFEHRYEVSSSILNGEQTQVAVLDGQHRLFQRRAGDALDDLRPDKLYGLADHLGSATAQTDSTGTLVSREEYYPFGETSFGSHEKQRYHFCGKELDAENGLYYYGARYYAAWICRFVSVDPLADEYAYYTPYQYAGNKPISKVDIDGLEESGGKPSPPSYAANNTHTVQKGETLAQIAKVHNTSVSALYVNNPGLPAPAKLPVGARLFLGFGINDNLVHGFSSLTVLNNLVAQTPTESPIPKTTQHEQPASIADTTPWPDPFNGKKATNSEWLRRNGSFHGAHDYPLLLNYSITNPAVGKLAIINQSSPAHLKEGYGNYVVVNYGILNSGEHKGKTLYGLYGHMTSLSVQTLGAEVRVGQELGKSGHTGFVKGHPGTHLHWELFVSAKYSTNLGSTATNAPNLPSARRNPTALNRKILVDPKLFISLLSKTRQPLD
jgi:RHS repeat-associated protein